MAKQDQLRLVLNPEEVKYKPGDTIAGKLIAVFTAPKKCKGIQLKLTGQAEIRFSMRESGTPDATETYWTLQTYLVGDGKSKIVLPSGTSEFPFAFILPPGLPSSYKSKYAKLVYKMDATMKNTWVDDMTTSCVFNVEATVDLNTILISAEPQCVSVDEDVGKLFMYSGSQVESPEGYKKIGYVPGEALMIHGEVHNHSKKDIQEIALTIIQLHRFRVKGYVKPFIATAAKLTYPGVPSFGQRIIREESLSVPQMPPTDLGGCNVIGLEYKIRLQVKLKRCMEIIYVEVPMFLGTMPLASAENEERELPPYSELDFPAPPPSALTTKHGASAPALNSDDDDMPFPLPPSPPPYCPPYNGSTNGAWPSSARRLYPTVCSDVYASATSLPSSCSTP